MVPSSPKTDTNERFSVKIVGASGQGINSIGEILAKALKRVGYWVYAYREYPSLIKGGHATYQIEFGEVEINSASFFIDVLVVLNKQRTNWHLEEMKSGSVIFHDISNPRINKDEAKIIKEKNIKLVYVPSLRIAEELGGNEIVTNIVIMGSVWKCLRQDIKNLNSVTAEVFADKPKFLELDIKCQEAGFNFQIGELPDYPRRLPQKDEISEEEKNSLHTTDLNSLEIDEIESHGEWNNNLLITGNETLAIGAVNAGVRIHFSYPMTPSSSILSYLADKASETGMIVKQAEGEITAAAMAIGAMHAGTRALTGTSGGGFDLMTEHVSMAAITEIPFVCVLAQRPGPATGLPTWTAQGDLLLAIFSGHGEYSRCVISCRDAEDAFYSVQLAFNIAEEYQIPVILLTDKLIAETLYTIKELNGDAVPIDRGELVVNEDVLSQIAVSERFAITDSGVSKRWLPGGNGPGFNANSDEHDEEGNVTEESELSANMIAKRIRKEETLKKVLPDPELIYNNVDLNNNSGKVRLIGWGSVYGVIKDVMHYYEKKNIKIDYLDIKYLWPLKTETIIEYLNADCPVVLIENNATAQLAKLIKMETGLDIQHKLLKWDGRPFFIEDVIEFVDNVLS